MKKLLFYFVFLTLGVSAQVKESDVIPCITALGDIIVDEEVDFMTNLNAQCTNCYDWDIVAGNVSIITSSQDQQQTVKVRPNAVGSFTLKVTSFDETGCHTCSQTFTAVETTEPCFDPVFSTKFDCSPQGTGQIFLANLNIGIASVTYFFEPNNNIGYFDNFLFSNGQQGIFTSTPDFRVLCTYSPGTCPPEPNNYITLGVTIEFNNGVCETISENFDIEVIDTGGTKPLILQLFPNPSNNSESINFEGIDHKEVSQIEIFDLQGNSRMQIKPNEQNFSFKNLDAGIYIVKFTTVNNAIIQKKLVIE